MTNDWPAGRLSWCIRENRAGFKPVTIMGAGSGRIYGVDGSKSVSPTLTDPRYSYTQTKKDM
tara:strand:- start:111 stop:296 length:186 start_codon:yes stop_codon:yes gene_type:complete